MNRPTVVAPTTTEWPQTRQTGDAAALVFQRRAKRFDRFARALISISGVAVICAVLGIGVFLIAEIIPLLQPASVRPGQAYTVLNPLEQPQVGVIDEYQEHALVIGTDPIAHVVSLASHAPVSSAVTVPIPELEHRRITAAAPTLRSSTVALGTDNGVVWVGTLAFQTDFEEGQRIIRPVVELEFLYEMAPGHRITHLAYRAQDDQATAAAIVDGGGVVVTRLTFGHPLIGPVRRSQDSFAISLTDVGSPTQVLLDETGRQLIVGTSRGLLLRWRLQESLADLVETTEVAPAAAVNAMTYLLGDRSILIGGSDGSVATWSLVRPEGVAEGHLQRLHAFPPHATAIASVAASPRNKGFLTASNDGEIRLCYMTSERTLATWKIPHAPAVMMMAPKTNGALLVDEAGQLSHWRIRNPYPEFSWRALFGKVWYEGYAKPDYSWQSSGGTDDFESKFSLVPLMFGTLKGTCYALLFAVPLALFGALYCSQFLEKRLRSSVKSIVELMAVLPSVVLGFIIGVVLAPLVQAHLVSVLSLPVIVPLVVLGGMAMSWQIAGRANPVIRRQEFWLLVGWLVIGVAAAWWISPWCERVLFGGNFESWLMQTTATRYDQRNSLVVGWAMGFAVIPIIFTLCEDAFSSVPRHLVGASLACGASAWQTAWRVVMPAAGSGVFSAIMVGFGRAVGETMIVLMATGNTPIMDWSIFNGFRALSANIAVEIPEAPQGETLYRILFMAALLLFVLTSVVNTVAEVIRLRLRRQLQGL